MTGILKLLIIFITNIQRKLTAKCLAAAHLICLLIDLIDIITGHDFSVCSFFSLNQERCIYGPGKQAARAPKDHKGSSVSSRSSAINPCYVRAS